MEPSGCTEDEGLNDKEAGLSCSHLANNNTGEIP